MRTSVIAALAVIVIAGALLYASRTSLPAGDEYDPAIDPSGFVSSVAHEYFALPPGARFEYESQNDAGTERILIEVTDTKKTVLGVPVTEVRDRVYRGGVLVEDTRDWYAEDREGNVWYFGEEVRNYEDGAFRDSYGSWEAGTDGAKPGIIMKADPKAGDSYRQEYYAGIAEDMADVVALGKEVAISYGTFEDCLQTRDWSKIDSALNEYKYYCPSIGFWAKEEEVANAGMMTVLVRSAGVRAPANARSPGPVDF